MSKLRPYARFDHGPEDEEDVDNGPCAYFVPRTRAEILESAAFRYRFDEQFTDKVTDLQLAMLAHYVSSGDEAAAGRLFAEIAKPIIEEVVDWIKEDDRLSGGHVSR